MRGTATVAAAAALLLLACATLHVEASRGLSGATADLTKQHAPDELLVQYRAGASDAQKKTARGKAAGTARLHRISNYGGAELELVKLSGKTVAQAIKLIGADANVLFAEPNYVLEAIQAPVTVTDPYFISPGCQLWGLYGPATTPCANQFGSNVTGSWAAGTTGSSTVYVGVIDEGIQVRWGMQHAGRLERQDWPWGRDAPFAVCLSRPFALASAARLPCACRSPTPTWPPTYGSTPTRSLATASMTTTTATGTMCTGTILPTGTARCTTAAARARWEPGGRAGEGVNGWRAGAHACAAACLALPSHWLRAGCCQQAAS
jgi:hypothetical protein